MQRPEISNLNEEDNIVLKNIEGAVLEKPPVTVTPESDGQLELGPTKPEKGWKKITKFFKHESRSTKSNDDEPATSKESVVKDFNIEQKWQSLGKVFRRHSFAEWSKSPENRKVGESSSQQKKLGVRKIVSSYISKLTSEPTKSGPSVNTVSKE